MGLLKLKTKTSVEDYLEGEKISPVKHEYIEGEVFALAGASDNHARIIINLTTALSVHLRDSDCEPFSNDIKVRVTSKVYYYPDVLVSCEENPENPYFRNQPILIIEVASPSTANIDRREKLLFYQQMPSVREYAVIDRRKINIELHRRQSDGRWITYYFDADDEEITFESVEMTLPIAEIYRRVRFEKKNANTDYYE
ncbi:MAG: Uma2 family endonuclease, partial [Pyrinomonadaceae bacterium]